MVSGSLDDEFSGLLYYVVVALSHMSSRFQIFTLIIPCIIMKEISHVTLTSTVNFMVAPCISNIKHFIVQLMHTNYKILRLLK